MYDLNCPSCGTTYQSTKSGYCDCCGFEFTDAYINQVVSAEKKKQKEIQKKTAEENRQSQLLVEKEEREKLAKAKAEKKARLEADKAYRKERKTREKVVSRIKKNPKRYEKELKFSLGFKKFGKAVSALGIILVILSVIGSVSFSNELGVDFILPQNVIADKIETIKAEHLISVKFDEKQNILKKSKNTEDTVKLSKGSIRLFNSICTLISNQSTIEEKLMYMFPRSTAFVNEFLESSRENKSMTGKNENFSEKNEQID